MDSAWIAVIGTLGGVVAGGATSLALERMTWTRQDREADRRDAAELVARRRERCVAFSSLAEECSSRLWSMHDYRSADPEAWRADDYVQQQQDLLESANSQLERAYHELWILGMGEFREEARELHRALVRAFNVVYDDPSEAPDTNDIAAKMGAFLEAVANDEVLGTQTRSADIALTQSTESTPRRRPRRRR
jgi:hypothetical protein